MPSTPELTPQIEQVLIRYLHIQQEEKRIEEEKRQLRQELTSLLGAGDPYLWNPVVLGMRLSVHHRVTTSITYNEQLLLQRLGERYVKILSPDQFKLRRNLGAVEQYLEPALTLIGSPNRDKVRTAIETGIVKKEEFEGAFEKTLKHQIVVARPGQK